LYLYDIKIQTDINQNGVKKSVGKSQFKKKKTQKKIEMNWAGPILAQPRGLG
jgi:hypothetical protein